MLDNIVGLKLAILLEAQIGFVRAVIAPDTISDVSALGVVSGYVLGHFLLDVLVLQGTLEP